MSDNYNAFLKDDARPAAQQQQEGQQKFVSALVEFLKAGTANIETLKAVTATVSGTLTAAGVTVAYLANSETAVNTNGVVSKTISGGTSSVAESGTPILSNTAYTYYDMTLAAALTARSVVSLEFFEPVTAMWTDVTRATYGASPNTTSIGMNGASTNPYGAGVVASGSATVIRVGFNQYGISISGVGNTSWATLKATYTRWRVKIQ